MTLSTTPPPRLQTLAHIAETNFYALDDDAEYSVQVTGRELEPGLFEYDIAFTFPNAGSPSPILLEWYVPLVDIVGKWHPMIGADRSLTAEWVQTVEHYATRGAPVYALFSESGRNRHVFALSDAINPVGIRVQVEEDNATVGCRLDFFTGSWPALDEYRVTLRIDERPIVYHKALEAVGDWWAGMDAYRPAAVPDAAYDPVYSTWYSCHQELTDAEIERHCAWSRKYGCKTVIVDDGWQTDDSNKGYDFCGDWEIATSKLPDFPAHVERVKALGMSYLLWFSVPFVGIKSEAWRQFHDRTLPKPRRNADCLDPRFASVRRMLIDIYLRAVGEWGMDGLKLDFVDSFTADPLPESTEEKPDMVSVPAATDRLFTDIMNELRSLKPDVLIEFRQNYIGPAMRKYGNIFRAQDCPNDAISNRVRTLDLRLLCGNTAVHSDMIMWHPEESVERAAQQMWASLFSVPQISVDEEKISREQQQMLKAYLDFWLERKQLLMHGDLQPLQPQNLYPAVIVENGEECLAAVYQAGFLLEIPEEKHRITLVNATCGKSLPLDFGEQKLSFNAEIYDCMGQRQYTSAQFNGQGTMGLAVPPSGYAILIA